MSETTPLVTCQEAPFHSRKEAAPHRAAMAAQYGGHWAAVPCPYGEHFHVRKNTQRGRRATHNRLTRRSTFA